MAEISKPDYTYLWSSGGSNVAPSNVKIQTGWTAEVPPFQWENWSQNRQDQAIAHILQHGISVWDSATEYQAGKSYVQGSNGKIYKAITTHVNVNPVTDTLNTSWVSVFQGGLIGPKVITTTGTYTATAGTSYIVVEVVGGGGGSGGTSATGAAQVSVSGGGGGGGYAQSIITSGFSGTLVTVGAGGSGGAAGANPGGPGTQSSFGAFCSATGGGGGQGGGAASTTAASMAAGGAGGVGVGGNILAVSGSFGGNAVTAGVDIGRGAGGVCGRGFRSGGNGIQSGVSQPAAPGSVGVGGVVIIWEYS